MISLTPSWLKPLKPSFRSRFSRCEPIVPSARNVSACDGVIKPWTSSRSIRVGHRPRLALGEGLAEVREVSEWLHGPNTMLPLKLFLQRVEVENTFEVMHARLQERLAV